MELPSLKEIKKERARRNLLSFVLYTMPNYEVNWHHESICNKLDQFAKGEIQYLMIFVPPQHGKSQLSSRHFPAYKLGLTPSCKIAVCSYSGTLSGGFNRDCQRLISSNEYKEIFPNTRLAGKNSRASDDATVLRNSEIFETVDHKGFFKSAYVRGPLTGTSVDVGIIDDPFKDRLEAESQRMRDNVWDWYVDVFSTRLHNQSQQLILLTRWHEDDLAGRLLAEDDEREKEGKERKWTVVTYPAIKEPATSEGDPREIGEALWESKHSRERILDQKSKSERTFNSLYQQNPKPLEGNIIKTEKFNIITAQDFEKLAKNKPYTWQFKVDGAYTDKSQNDASAMITATLIDNQMYIKKVESVRKELPELCEWIVSEVKELGYSSKSFIRIEPKANGLSTIQSIKKGTKLNVEAYKFPKVRGVRLDDKDKVTRAFAITEIIQTGRITLIDDGSNWPKTFKAQCAAFPAGKHDDEVDVFVMQVLEFFFEKEAKKVSSTRK
jgi:predicted phage terminase large subunit-like protein